MFLLKILQDVLIRLFPFILDLRTSDGKGNTHTFIECQIRGSLKETFLCFPKHFLTYTIEKYIIIEKNTCSVYEHWTETKPSTVRDKASHIIVKEIIWESWFLKTLFIFGIKSLLLHRDFAGGLLHIYCLHLIKHCTKLVQLSWSLRAQGPDSENIKSNVKTSITSDGFRSGYKWAENLENTFLNLSEYFKVTRLTHSHSCLCNTKASFHWN